VETALRLCKIHIFAVLQRENLSSKMELLHGCKLGTSNKTENKGTESLRDVSTPSVFSKDRQKTQNRLNRGPNGVENGC